MGNLNNYVTVTISKNSVGITRAGFGTMLILSQTVAWGTRTRTYTDYASGAVDFPNTLSPENRALTAAFAQSPAPKKVKVGMRTNKSTLVYQMSALTPTTQPTYTYQVWVSGDAFARQLVTFTSDGTPTDAEWAAGFVTALNAVVSKNYTATGAASPVTITATAAGGWFHIEVVNPNDIKVVQTHADPGVTADLVAIAIADPDFYGIVNFTNATAEATAIAAWTEANKRTFILDGNQTDTINTDQPGGSDLMKAMQTATYTRTLCFYHHRLDQMPAAALYGRCFPLTPGSETWADKTLAGVDPTPYLTDTHRVRLIARNANGYESVATLGITFQGKAASGDFLDTTRFLDAFADDAQKSIFGAKVASSKISYDDPGIRKIANEFRGALFRGVDAGGFVKGSIVMVIPNSADVAAADRTARVLNGLKAFAQLTGAIQTVNVAINVVA